MTPEERFERLETGLLRLEERHAALTGTVEIIAGMQKKNEEHLDRIEENIGRIGEDLSRLISVSTEILQIVKSHETRLHRLENGK